MNSRLLLMISVGDCPDKTLISKAIIPFVITESESASKNIFPSFHRHVTILCFDNLLLENRQAYILSLYAEAFSRDQLDNQFYLLVHQID